MTEVEYEFSLRPNDDQELGRYVIGFHGKAVAWDEDRGQERVIGEIQGHRLDLAGAEYDGVEKQLLFESISPEIAEFAETVLQEQGCHLVSQRADGVIEHRECSGLIYINELRVDAAYRGQLIGSELIRKIGQMVDVTDCVIALKAFPLSDTIGQPVPAERIPQLKRFYHSLGFVPAGKEFMVKQSDQCDMVQKRIAWRHKHPSRVIG